MSMRSLSRLLILISILSFLASVSEAKPTNRGGRRAIGGAHAQASNSGKMVKKLRQFDIRKAAAQKRADSNNGNGNGNCKNGCPSKPLDNDSPVTTPNSDGNAAGPQANDNPAPTTPTITIPIPIPIVMVPTPGPANTITVPTIKMPAPTVPAITVNIPTVTTPTGPTPGPAAPVVNSPNTPGQVAGPIALPIAPNGILTSGSANSNSDGVRPLDPLSGSSTPSSSSGTNSGSNVLGGASLGGLGLGDGFRGASSSSSSDSGSGPFRILEASMTMVPTATRVNVAANMPTHLQLKRDLPDIGLLAGGEHDAAFGPLLNKIKAGGVNIYSLVAVPTLSMPQRGDLALPTRAMASAADADEILAVPTSIVGALAQGAVPTLGGDMILQQSSD